MKTLLSIFVLAASLNAQTVLQSWDGETGTVSSPGVPTVQDHPDMALASNGYQIVTSDRQSVNVYSYSGQLISTQSLTAFITAAGLTAGTPRDPYLAYDRYIDRFILVCSCNTDHFIVSGSSDATKPWKGVDLGASGAGDLTMHVGFNRQGVYVTEDNVANTSVYYVVALPSGDVAWTGVGNVSLTHENIFNNQNYDIQPAIDIYDDGTHTEYFVVRDGPQQNGTNVAFNLLVNGLTWVGNTASLSANTTIATPYLYNTPVDNIQPSTPNIKGTESHLTYQPMEDANGNLHVVLGSGPCASSCGTQGTDTGNLIFWFIITPTTLSQSAKISSASLGYIFPTSAIDNAGNDYICATSSGSAQNASIDCWTHKTTDSAGAINGPTRVITGTQVYAVCGGNNPVGWGTYSKTTYDPLNPTTVWTLQEYGASATACLWQERVAQLQIAAPTTPLPGPAPMLTLNSFPGQQLTEEDLSLWRF